MKLLPGVREGVVRSPRTSVSYYDSADPEDPRTPIVLLHGTGGSAASHFWALFPMLAEHHRVIALDFADPTNTSDDLNAAWYVDQAEAVITALSPQRPVHVVGYSLGAVIATALSARRQDLVESLILIAGWLKTDQQQQLRNEIWSRLHTEGSSALARFMVFTAYSPAFLLAKTDREVEELIENAAKGPNRTTQMRLNRHVDLTDAANLITAHALVVACTEDNMVPPHHGRLLFGAIQNARYAEVRSGHAIVHERPAELYHLVDQFIADPTRTAPGSTICQEPV